jgi:hypothetical protein
MTQKIHPIIENLKAVASHVLSFGLHFTYEYTIELVPEVTRK